MDYRSANPKTLVNSTSHHVQDEPIFTIDERPARTPRRLRIIGIGAGMAGINLAMQVNQRRDEFDLVVYEKAPQTGGNWYWNQYPGLACDNPSHMYQFINETKRDWNSYYSNGLDVRRYFQDIVTKYSLEGYFVLEHEITKAEWKDETSTWTVTFKDLRTGEVRTDEAEILMNNTGPLHHPRWPQLPKLSAYKGVLVHASRYPDELDLKNKKVAVLGSGSTGIQIVPAIMNDASQVYHWIRQPTWVFPLVGAKNNFEFTATQKERFASSQEYYLKYRKALESDGNKKLRCLIRGTPESEALTRLCTKYMSDKLALKPEIRDAIIPKTFGFGCRRPTPGPGYLESLTNDKVQVFLKELREMTDTGFIDHEGSYHEADVFICATGYDTSFVPFFPILSRGENLQSRWAQSDPDCYLSLATPGFPNYFMTSGSFGATAHGSAPPIVEITITSILNIAKKLADEQIASIEPTREATDDFLEYAKHWLPRTVFTDSCRSWGKSAWTGLPLSFPGSRVQLIEAVRNFRGEDWKYRYLSKNRFRYFGNGFHPKELGDNDDTYYLGLLGGKVGAPDYDQILDENSYAEEVKIVAS